MSRIFGPIIQNGYVVRDLDAALKHWTGTIGVGPFFLARGIAYSELAYRGKPVEIEMTAAIAYSGGLQIELVQQHSPGPSAYREFLGQGQGGLHHVGVTSENYAADFARLAALGYQVLQGGRAKAGVSFAYFDTGGGCPGSIIELIELTPGIKRYFERIKRTAETWDGSDPVRNA